MDNFYFVSDYGKILLPTKSEIDQIQEDQGESILLILDSSICIDIINLIKHKKKAHCDKKKIYNLIKFVQQNEIEYFTLYALLELCYDRETFEMQSDKFFGYKNMIDYTFRYPLKKFKRFEYDFFSDCLFFPNPELENNALRLIIEENINLYYAAILKICEIGQKGLGAAKAQKNIQEFINWMESDLNVILGVEYSLALEVFGGNTKLLSMIKLGAPKEKILKASWGTAWDIFHSKMSCNKEQLSYLVSRKVFPIFATKDSYLFDLISPKVNYYQRVNKSKMSIKELGMYPPNYSKEFINKLNDKMLSLISDRIGIPAKFDVDDLSTMIEQIKSKIK